MAPPSPIFGMPAPAFQPGALAASMGSAGMPMLLMLQQQQMQQQMQQQIMLSMQMSSMRQQLGGGADSPLSSGAMRSYSPSPISMSPVHSTPSTPERASNPASQPDSPSSSVVAAAAAQHTHTVARTGPPGANLFVFHLPNELTNRIFYGIFAPFGE